MLQSIYVPNLVSTWLMFRSQRCCCGLQRNSFLLKNCLHTLGYRLVTPESHPWYIFGISARPSTVAPWRGQCFLRISVGWLFRTKSATSRSESFSCSTWRSRSNAAGCLSTSLAKKWWNFRSDRVRLCTWRYRTWPPIDKCQIVVRTPACRKLPAKQFALPADKCYCNNW